MFSGDTANNDALWEEVNQIDLTTALDIAKNCCKGYRIPEPTRLADKYVAELKKEFAIYA